MKGLPSTEVPLRIKQMQYVVLGFCVFATAYSGATPTAPASSLSQIGRGVAVAEAKGGSELPFKGNLQATEAVEGTLHHLVGTGNGTHLGRFTYIADITVDEVTSTGVGTVVWTAANGDQIFTSLSGEVVLVQLPNITIMETQIITGGTGRFVDASGTIMVDRFFNVMTGITIGSFTGMINLGH
jgi:hypothetical protein